MSATSIQIDTRVINNPTTGISPTAPNYVVVDRSISFYDLLSSSQIRTLSTNTASISSAPEGLLYVPRLDQASACNNVSASYVPQNVTRKSDLPTPNYPLIAFAPWLSVQCVEEYLAVGRSDLAKSFIFYLPNQGSGTPPDPSDPAWSLNDNNKWKSDNQYPVYAVSSDTGSSVMQSLAAYSGNLTSVPNGAQIATTTDSRNYVKLYTTIQLSATSGLPSLWIFLVAVLAILVVVVGFTSLVMHWLQRRRRENLRRRIAAGEVELETLGIKRVLVPQDVLDTMPVRQYEKDDPPADVPITNPPATATTRNVTDAIKGTPNPARHLDQPTCAICLDDFVPKESQVRQLPCGHIYHPECIDTFLMGTSSLCPLCKKSSLPPGYCPEAITNVMVRRERLIRQAQARARRLGVEIDPNEFVDRNGNFTQYRMRRAQDLEMARRQPRAPPPAATSDNLDQVRTVEPSPPPTQREARRRWAARRAEAMLGPHTAPTDAEDDATRPSRFQAGLRRIFPTAR